MSKGLKIFLSVLALISIVFSLAILFDWNPMIKIKKVFVSEKNPPAEILSEDLGEKEKNTAQATWAWIKDLKNEEGYLLSHPCLKDEVDVVTYSSRIFPSVLWGKLKYYEKKQESQGIVELEKDLDLALNIPTQSNQWNCKLMKDFWESSFLSQEQKEKAKVYCKSAGEEGFNNEAFGNINDVFTIDQNELKNGIAENIDNLIKGNPVSFKEFYFNDAESSAIDFEKSTAYASNDLYRYLLEKEGELKDNEAYLNVFFQLAFTNYYLSLQGYSVVEKNINNNSLLGIASADFYRITNEQRYLDMALYLFSKNEELEDNQTFYDYDNVYFAFLAKDLFELTGDEVYEEKMTSIKNKIITEQFTQPVCKDFEPINELVADNEKGGFKSGWGDFYLIKENALMLGLLSL